MTIATRPPVTPLAGILPPSLKAQTVVHSDGDVLFGADLSFCRLSGALPEQKLVLFEVYAGLPAELGADPP